MEKIKYIAVSLVVGLILGGVAAWFGRPAEIREVERVKVVEKVVEARKNNVVTQRIIETKPNGETKTTETIVDKSTTDKATESERVSFKSTEKKTPSARWEITTGVSFFGSAGRNYLLGINYNLFGPFSVGSTIVGDPISRSGAVYGTMSWRF